MRVFLASAYPYHNRFNCTTTYLQESAKDDPYKIHTLVSDPENADIIIFTEHHPAADPYFFRVLRNKIYRRHKKKCYLYHDNDNSLTFLPTISPSIEASKYNPVFHRSYSYIYQIDVNIHITQSGHETEKKYLFSFMGSSITNSIRKDILSLEQKDSYLLDTLNKNSWELSAAERDDYFKFYAKICLESKFILCPRGLGPNSYRLYECIKMGIPPVIISDEWVPSEGPVWDDFSIRIAEKDINKIPEILKKKEEKAEQMGQLALKAWDEWFSKDKQFHLLTETCLSLHESRQHISFLTYIHQYLQFFEQFHFRNLLRHYKNRLKKVSMLVFK